MKATQREILKRVSIDETQFNADLRQIVEESLKRRNVDNADVYNLIALHLNCNGGKATEVDDLYDLCRLVYVEWFTRQTAKAEQDCTPQQWQAIQILKAKYPAHRMSAEECYKSIACTYRAEFADSGLSCPAKFQQKPIEGNDNGVVNSNGQIEYRDFLHIFPRGRAGDESCRLYLNLKPGNAIIFEKLLYEAVQPEVQLYTKVNVSAAGCGNRSDNVLVYCSYDDAAYIIEQINFIRKNNPELFEDCEKLNPFLGKIDGYIGVGEEPTVKDPKDPKHNFSFTQARACAITEYINESKAKLYRKIGDSARNETKTSVGGTISYRDTLIQRYIAAFKVEIEQKIADAANGKVPPQYEGKGAKAIQIYKDYLQFVKGQLDKCNEKGGCYTQIEAMVDEDIEQLKKGKCPTVHSRRLTFQTQSEEKAMALRGHKLHGKEGVYEMPIDFYSLKLDEMLDEDFKLKDMIRDNADMAHLAPYLARYNVSARQPHLNLTTAKELKTESESE